MAALILSIISLAKITYIHVYTLCVCVYIYHTYMYI